MIKKLKRFGTVLLMQLILVTTLSIQVMAATGTVNGLSIATSGSTGTITTGSNSVTLTVEKGWSFLGGTAEDTFRFTNPSTNTRDLKISFDYSFDGTSKSISGVTEDTGSKCAATLNPGSSFSVYVKATAGKLSGAKSTFTITNLSVVEVIDSAQVTVAFDASLGNVTVNGSEVEASSVVTVPNTGSTFVATNSDNVSFLAWTDNNGKIVSREKNYVCTPTEAEMMLRAVFVTNSPWFYVDNSDYLVQGWDAAMKHTGTVALANNASLPAGNYSVPSGVTLLIPYDNGLTCSIEKPVSVVPTQTQANPTAYRTLTMEEGAHITVNGTMTVPAAIRAGDTTQAYAGGMPYETYGHVAMNSGSSITVKNGAKLSVFGYITGAGSVVAEPNAKVYESFQIMRFRGGSATASMSIAKKTFPVSQYYAQNIEVPLTLYSGASEVAYTCLYMSDEFIESSVEYIGSSDCLFNLGNGYLVKQYDKANDRQQVDIHGDLTVSKVVLNINFIISYTINSEDYIMPITSNMTVDIHDGATVSIGGKMSMLPGAEINIHKGGALKLASGKSLYLYDLDEWLGKGYVYSLSDMAALGFAPNRTKTRTVSDLKDAQIIVEGTLDASAGKLCTSAGGASIKGQEGGQVLIAYANATTDVQAIQNGTDVTYENVAMNSAYLQNGNGEYLITATDTYTYSNGVWNCTNHTYGEGVETIPATCTEEGVKTFTCTVEGCTAESEGHTKTEAIPALGHTATETPAKAPTCTEKGNSAYWTCQTCGKFYSDADCTAEIAKDSWVIQINPDAHTFGQPQFTWNDYECSAKVVCDCNAEQSVDVTVTPEVTTTATCTVRGVKTYTATAVYNGETYTAETQPTEDLGLNTDNHQNTTEHGQSNATCTENGYTAGTYCNDCKTWISGHEVIESNGHTYANPVVVFSQDGTTYTVKVTCSVCETAEKTSESKTSTVGETTPGDCQTNSTTIYTASGSYEGVSYSETKTVEGAKGDHSDANNDGNHTCDRDGCTETVSNCEDKGKDHICDTDSACTVYSTGSNEHTPAAGSHDCAYCGQAITECEFTVQGDVKIPATCVTKAVYEAKCSVCGTVSETETIEGVVDPKAHNLMDIPAQTATCTQIGWNAYQKCQNEGCNYSTYVEIPMLEHDYADKWSSNGSGHWHACKNCTATIDATTHTEAEAVKENEIAPTYNTTGSYDSVVYCSVCNYEIRRKTVTEPMLQGVAKVGDTNYGTLADAVEAAEDGQTVTLLTDAELTERLTVKKKIVLDLSGKTITAGFTDDFGAIYIGTSGDLTVTGNGTVLSMQDIIFANYGKITIENGTFKSEGETYNAALYNMYHSGDVYGTATIKGGNFETDVWNSGMLTVENGTLEGIDNSGKTVITGGTVNGEILNGDGSDAPDLAEKGTIAISGGTFANAVDQTWCAEGYGPTDNGDGTYGVHLHTAGTAAKENVVAATCTTDGSYDTVVRCTQCYAVLSTQTTVVGKLNHEDPNNDGDHICDHEGCNAVVTTCGDSDKDHICDTDSACTAYSTGENAHGDGDDANHTCDYCSGTVEGEVCTDNNSDHKCDECGQTMSQCSDEDADHDCDVCGATMGTHEAAEGKHTCDYCGQTVTQCSDEDTDHDCDVCGATMGTHEAAEGKHTCDYCGQTVTQCSDSDDTDHKCDTCGQDNITDHVYGEVTYTGDGINSYAAERSCACGEKQTASVTITSAVTREATCTAEGETTYTADFAEDWAQDKTTTETIAKKPHTYGDLAWSWTGSDETGYTAATATFQCSCGDTQTETDDQLEKVTTDATYEAAGSDVYTAKVTFEGKEYTDTKMVTIPQLTAKVIYGDVDGDGYVTSIDATQVLLYVAQKIQEIRVTEADVDGDANITSMDATEILLYVAKKITEFTVEKAK